MQKLNANIINAVERVQQACMIAGTVLQLIVHWMTLFVSFETNVVIVLNHA